MGAKSEWEAVSAYVDRLAIPGGYLYRIDARYGDAEHVVFVPHPPAQRYQPETVPAFPVYQQPRYVSDGTYRPELSPIATQGVGNMTARQVAQQAFSWPRNEQAIAVGPT